MKTIVFFLEEPSAREMLAGILPRILPSSIQVRYIVFRGKQDLEKNLKKKLCGWRLPDSIFVVMRDQDSGDCKAIKNQTGRPLPRSRQRGRFGTCCLPGAGEFLPWRPCRRRTRAWSHRT